MDIANDKAVLRKQMRAIRKAIEPERRAKLEAELETRLLSLSAMRHVKCIAAYCPAGSETRFVTHLDKLFELEQGPTVAFPIVQSQTSMSFYRFEINDDRAILANPTQPVPDIDASRLIEPSQIDLMLVPGIAFNERGHRLGQGGGYYDRYLPLMRGDCMLIGVAFDEQIVDAIPRDANDMSVNYIITPTRLITAY